MSQSSISVVIPTFKQRALLPQAIETVLAQTIATREIIVVDDGSTDDTRERVIPDPGRTSHTSPKRTGALRRPGTGGVEAATGEFIAFLDADDVWHPRKLEIQLRAMAGNPDLALLATGTFAWPATGFPAVDHRPVAATSTSSVVAARCEDIPPTSSVLVLQRHGPGRGRSTTRWGQGA